MYTPMYKDATLKDIVIYKKLIKNTYVTKICVEN